jgi:Protein of unknown function (DUF2752)
LLRDQQSERRVAAPRAEIPGLAAAATGFVLLSQLAVLRFALTTAGERVYLLGRAVPLACALRARFGLPCPTCGMTRGIVLAAHGQIADAWRIFPAAALGVLGIAVGSLALLALAWLEYRAFEAAHARLARALRRAGLAYAGITTVIWIAAWLHALAHTL